MAKPTPTHPESEPTDLRTSSLNHEGENHDSHADAQQPFRFLNLPPELREIIYIFALEHGTIVHPFHGEIPDEPQLTAGLSGSVTARALSKVCRIIRYESIKAYYSKTTFTVLSLPNPTRIISKDLSVTPGCPREPRPLKLWALTWGVRGAQHIRSLRIGYSRAVVRISVTDKGNPVSLENESRSSLNASAVNAAGLKAFGTTCEGETEARKFERFLSEVGRAYHTKQDLPYKNQRFRKKRPV